MTAPAQIAAAAETRTPAGGQVPPAPEDFTAAKVYALLERTCAQCHQAGRTKGRPTVGGLADILAVDDLAMRPHLVRPGVPDASRLYDILVRRHAPFALPPPEERGAERVWANSSEIQTVREWIAALAPRSGDACPTREKVTPEQIATALTQHVTETPTPLQPNLRFLSLAVLHNACTPTDDLESARHALTRLLNSLSWAKYPTTVRFVGPQRTIAVVDLSDLGWVAAHWQRLVAVYPYAPWMDAPLEEAVMTLVESAAPILRADWFAKAASTAPLYYDLVGMPERVRDLEQLLSVNSTNLVLRGAAVRAGIEISEITTGPRMIERLPARTGSFWRAYDLPPSKPGEKLADMPVGPDPVPGVERTFRQADSRVMFSSPNGFMMFGVFDASGARVNAAAEGVDRDISHKATAGSCLACHAAGPLTARDELRGFAGRDGTPRPVRDAILALHFEQASIDGLMAEDRQRLAEALDSAGVDPKRTIRGRDPLAAIIERYEQGGDLTTIAIEAGLSIAEINRLAQLRPEEIRVLVLRAASGPLVRTAVDRVVMSLGGRAQAGGPAIEAKPAVTEQTSDGTKTSTATTASVAVPTSPLGNGTASKAGPIELVVWPTKPEFKLGDLAAFHVRTSADCYLTLISVDTRGIATVLFPNDFERDNLLTAGRVLKVPADTAAYQFRLKGAGREVVIGMCTQQSRTFQGVEHDFERTRFTVLGNWSVFVTDQLALIERQEADGASGGNRTQRGKRDRTDKSEAATIASSHGHAAFGYEIKP